MISVLFCSRVKDNPDSNIARLLDSAAAFISPAESRQIEFLIKYDDDDDATPGQFLCPLSLSHSHLRVVSRRRPALSSSRPGVPVCPAQSAAPDSA